MTKGVKHDKEKPRWSLLPWRCVELVVMVLTYGSRKYADDNWKHVKPVSRYWDAMERHLTARRKGKVLDPESHLPHLAHAACCLLFLMWHDLPKGGA